MENRVMVTDERFSPTVETHIKYHIWKSEKNEQIQPAKGARPDQDASGKLVLSQTHILVVTSGYLENGVSEESVVEGEKIATEQNGDISELEANGRPTNAMQVKPVKPADSSQAKGRAKTSFQSGGQVTKITAVASLDSKASVAQEKANQPSHGFKEVMSMEKKKKLACPQQMEVKCTPITLPAGGFKFKLNIKTVCGVMLTLFAFGDAGLVLSEEHTEQVAAELGTLVTLPSLKCTGDEWYYQVPNKTEAKICEDMVYKDGWKKKDLNNTCFLVFNVTEENTGIYRNKEFDKDISKSYNVSGTLKCEEGRATNSSGFNDSWTTHIPRYNDNEDTKLQILTGIFVSLGIFIITGIIFFFACKCYQRIKDRNGRLQEEWIPMQPLNDISVRVD